MASCRAVTAEALEEHFDRNMFRMLEYFHVAGATVSMVSYKEPRPTPPESAVNAYYADELDRLPSLRPRCESKTSTSEHLFRFSKSFGFDDIEKEELVTCDTLFDSGTCARVLSGLALSQLEGEGKISMQSYASKYLSDYMGEATTLEELFERRRSPSPSSDKENDGEQEEEREEDGTGLCSRSARDWDEHASWCAEQIIEKASGLSFRTYMETVLLPRLGISLQKVSEEDGKDCFTYLYKNKNKRMMQLKTLQSKLTVDSGLIVSTAQMNRILAALVSEVHAKGKDGCREGYGLLPGFGFGFKSVSFVPGGLNFFVCVSAMRDNGNSVLCIEPTGKWAIWIACNTCSEDKGNFNDLFRGEPLCYFILKEFISEFGLSQEMSRKSLSRWTIDPAPGRGDHIATLFCFPYVGGNGRQVFKNWHTLLPEFIEVKSVSLPGRGPRINEPPRTHLLRLAEEIAVGILPSLKDKRFCFYGDGIGALLAFEVGRYLQVNHGLSPMWCFFSGSPSPTTYGTAVEGSPLLEAGNKLNAAMMERLCSCGKLPKCLKENPLLARAMLPSIQSDMQMESNYRYKRQPYKHVKCDEYFCDTGLDTLSALTPNSSPRRDMKQNTLRLACPISIFRDANLSEQEEAEISQWELVTDSEALFVTVPGSVRIDKDLKTMEDICKIISDSVGGTSLTKQRFESWIGWAARCL